ncbi:hypothetical protein BSN82_17750, partial [Acinetobacter baylyi]|uniref:hypothetical protein n=1 Tax=Acinetobacter baylyi TaxID=202950 RepID=UPI001C08680D
QVDVANNKNPFSILINLSKLLARPAIYKETDPHASINIDSVRLAATTNNFFGLRTATGSANNYYPNSTHCSPLSFMVENNRRGQDGILYLISKTKLVTGLVNLLAELGKPAKNEGRGKVLSGLIKIMGQVKMISTDTLPANGFDFYDYLTNSTDGLLTKLALYPDTRSTNLNSSDWNGVSDSVFFIRDYLSS